MGSLRNPRLERESAALDKMPSAVRPLAQRNEPVQRSSDVLVRSTAGNGWLQATAPSRYCWWRAGWPHCGRRTEPSRRRCCGSPSIEFGQLWESRDLHFPPEPRNLGAFWRRGTGPREGSGLERWKEFLASTPGARVRNGRDRRTETSAHDQSPAVLHGAVSD